MAINFQASECERFHSAVNDALLGKCGMPVERPAEGALHLQRKRLQDLGAESLRLQGFRVESMTDAQIFSAAMDPTHIYAAGGGVPLNSVGSLPNILSNVQSKTLQTAYDEAPVTYPIWCHRGESLPNFKPTTRNRFGEGEDLEMRGDKNEIAEAEFSDEAESYSVEEYAKKWGITFRMWMDDDLTAFARLPRQYGLAARRTINKACVEELTSNPTMADGVALFHAASHGNLVNAGAAPSVAELGIIRNKLRQQTGVRSEVTLNLTLAILLVPSALETVADQVVGSSADWGSDNPEKKNPFRSVLAVPEPQLDGTSTDDYFGFADPNLCPAIEYAFLTGQESPVIESWYDHNRKVRWSSVTQTFAVKAIDYRGVVRDDGGA